MKQKLFSNHNLFCQFSICLLVYLLISCSQRTEDYSYDSINKAVSEYQLGKINQSSPLNYYLTKVYALLEGKESLLAKISTSKFELDINVPDEAVSEIMKNRILSEKILEIVTYKDSVAAVVTEDVDGLILLNFTWIEGGKWVNGGQGLAESQEEADDLLKVNLPIHYSNLPRIQAIKNVPSNAQPFADYIRTAASPKDFMLSQLALHRLVIVGEYHRRKVSWDMYSDLIDDPRFADVCGTIFMELPSHRQSTMDEFLTSSTMNPELVLEIFRDEQIYGWWDKGEFDFICDLWRLNRKIPADKRINIRLADFQIPYSDIQSSDELKAAVDNEENRNTHMADVIEKYISTKEDHRSCLFMVGAAHVYKSPVPSVEEEVGTAGAQLAERLGPSDVFLVFQHVLPGDNSGKHKSQIRGGIFDKAFEINDNRPVGFSLVGSPFGEEPFDGLYELKYNAKAGKYKDNYDGYLFLHELKSEPRNEPLMDVFDNSFISEMKRRSHYTGWDNHKDVWFGYNADELSKDKIEQALSDD
ncbi:MAG: hypothetical protein MJY76_05940 [Bacteroidales bacterium]|nr:hypothetical protein [Bacteroidales bacterium]